MMRRKSFFAPLAACAAALMLTACRQEDHTEAIQSAAQTFLDALASGSLDAARGVASEELLADDTLQRFDETAMEEMMCEKLGIPDRGALEEKAGDALDAFCRTLIDEAVRDYEIVGVHEEEGIASVQAQVTLGFSGDMLEQVQSEADAALDVFFEEYQEENMDALLEVLNDEGEAALDRRIYNDLLPQILDSYADAVTDTEGMRELLTITLMQEEDDWRVTHIQEESEE